MPTAAEHAAEQVASVREDPTARLALLRSLYETPPGWDARRLPYRRAALAFMGWELRRGVLNPADAGAPGSPWWRAVNDRLLRDTAEARAHVLGMGGPISSSSVADAVTFIRQPSVRTWYRAHNAIIVRGYLDNQELAHTESRVERFFINVVLVRVLFAHALVAAPRLALGWLSPFAPVLGDPRLAITGIFLQLSRVGPITEADDTGGPTGASATDFVARLMAGRLTQAVGRGGELGRHVLFHHLQRGRA
ncbi:hypothetical protein [Mycobacterium sp. E2497]|uniref:hypothetical protein n=1 Tax=Mycobacterium sp. E2497 TaxID=1834135 RepID=UPI0018D4569D|nr:hypothetical protein [Mycobacterium sp. E2497]